MAAIYWHYWSAMPLILTLIRWCLRHWYSHYAINRCHCYIYLDAITPCHYAIATLLHYAYYLIRLASTLHLRHWYLLRQISLSIALRCWAAYRDADTAYSHADARYAIVITVIRLLVSWHLIVIYWYNTPLHLRRYASFHDVAVTFAGGALRRQPRHGWWLSITPATPHYAATILRYFHFADTTLPRISLAIDTLP